MVNRDPDVGLIPSWWRTVVDETVGLEAWCEACSTPRSGGIWSQGSHCYADACGGSNALCLAALGTSSSTAISGGQLNLTGKIDQPIPFEMKTPVPRGEVLSPLE